MRAMWVRVVAVSVKHMLRGCVLTRSCSIVLDINSVDHHVRDHSSGIHPDFLEPLGAIDKATLTH